MITTIPRLITITDPDTIAAGYQYLLLLAHYGAGSTFAETNAHLCQIGSAVPEGYVGLNFQAFEFEWGANQRRGQQQFYNDVTQNQTPNALLTACLSADGWIAGLQEVSAIRSRMMSTLTFEAADRKPYPIAMLKNCAVGWNDACKIAIEAGYDNANGIDHYGLCPTGDQGHETKVSRSNQCYSSLAIAEAKKRKVD